MSILKVTTCLWSLYHWRWVHVSPKRSATASTSSHWHSRTG